MEPTLIMAFVLSAASKISSVVVYPDRAQVVRTVSIGCSPGATAKIDGLPPSVDPDTIRAHTSIGTVEGIRSARRVRPEPFAPQLKGIQEQIDKLEKEKAAQRDARARSERRMKIAEGYEAVAASLISGEMAAPRPDLKAWGAGFDAALASRLKAGTEEVTATVRVREIDRQLEDLKKKAARLEAAAQHSEVDAEVLVSCPAGNQARIELSYLVGGSSWVPAYEARAQEADGMVELSTYVTIRQASGEDWSQVRLTLSTATPLQDATPPEIRPLKVFSEEREAERKVLVQRTEEQKHVETSVADPAGPPGSSQTTGRLQATSQGLSVQLAVPEPAEVPGDGKPVRLKVGASRLRAAFAYRTVPKLLPFVFRVADLTNTGAFPLLPGPVDAFGKSGFIGRSALERVAQGARFHLTFGIEEALKVKRTVTDEMKRDAGLFGSHARFHYAYAFDVANYLGRAEEIELAEHVPVSELDDVKVQIEPKTTAGFELAPEDGIVRWKVKLGPSEKRELKLAFQVDVPSSYDSGR
jgi:uncharacterized protein (TIGR02231 family)